MYALAVVVVLQLLCAPATLLAGPILPDDSYHALPCRPTVACTADLVPPGTVEIELGYLLRSIDQGTLQHSTPVLLKLTVTEWLQLQLQSNGAVFAPTGRPVPSRYADDIALGGKLHLQDQTAAAPSVSFSALASIPTYANQSGYIYTYDLLFTLYVSKDFGRLHADLNAGLNLWRIEQNPIPQGFVALALSAELPRRFTVMLEAYGLDTADPLFAADAGILSAVAYAPKPWLMLDLGGDAGLLQRSRSFSVFAGMTAIVADLWETTAERKRRAANRR